MSSPTNVSGESGRPDSNPEGCQGRPGVGGSRLAAVESHSEQGALVSGETVTVRTSGEVVKVSTEVVRISSERVVISEASALRIRTLNDLVDLGVLRPKTAESPGSIDARAVADLMANTLIQDHSFIWLWREETLMVYEGGLWTERGGDIVNEEVDRILAEYGNRHLKAEVHAHVRDRVPRFEDRSPFNPNKNLIPVLNGVVDIGSNPVTLKAYTPEMLITHRIPVEYRPGARCPKVEGFCQQVLPKGGVSLAWELFGWCLRPVYDEQIAIMLYGTGANGKGTFLLLLAAFLGRGNFASLPLGMLHHRFQPAALAGKLANLCGDMPQDSELLNTSMFKQLTGGDVITTERKGKPHFCFVNYCKLFFACNQFPYVEDPTHAFWRRWLLINFPNTFRGKDRKQQTRLLRELTSPEELSGLLNLAIQGLRRLIARGGFEETWQAQNVQREWCRKADPVRTFLEEMCDLTDPDRVTPKAIIYQAYVSFCQRNGVASATTREFDQRARQRTGAYDAVRRVDGRPCRVWLGISPRSSTARQTSVTEVTDVTDFTIPESKQGEDIQEKVGEDKAKPVTSVTSVTAQVVEPLKGWLEGMAKATVLDCARKLEKLGLSTEAANDLLVVLLRNGELYEPMHGWLAVASPSAGSGERGQG